MEEQAIEIAQQVIRNEGADPDLYNVEVQSEDELWRIIFTPSQPRIRGGGFEITIDKCTNQVKDVLHYQ